MAAQNPFDDMNFGSELLQSAPNPFDDPEFGAEKSEGFAARLGQGASRALDSAKTAMTDDRNEIAKIAADQARTALPQTALQRKMAKEYQPYVDAANKAEGVVDNVTAWGAAGFKRAGQFLSNPAETGKMMAEQLPNSLPGLAGGFAGMKAGAALGSMVGPVGTVVGGVLGGVAGGFAGGYGLEKGAAVQEQVQKEAQRRGIDIQDQAAVAGMVGENYDEIEATAQRKGVGTAGTDAIFNVATMGLAGMGGRAISKEAQALHAAVKSGAMDAAEASTRLAALESANAARNTLGAKALRGTGVIGAEMVGEGASEAVGQKYAYGEVDAGQVIDESFLGFGTGTAMALGGKAFNKAAGIVDQDATTQTLAAAQAEIERRVAALPDHQQNAERARLNAQMQAEARMGGLADEEMGAPDMAQGSPSDYRATPEWAKPPEDAAPDYASADDEIFQSTGTPQRVDPVREAVRQAADAGGALSAAAGVAMDSGAAPTFMPPEVAEQPQEPQPEPVVLQNRDRTSAASIAQMQEIAAAPDYMRAGPSREMATGAPVVFGDLPSSAALGRQEIVVDGRGGRVQAQYAVVDAADVIASNNADGTTVAEYANGLPGKLRAVAGNGRTAGLQAAYQQGTANNYAQELMNDAGALGIDPQAMASMQRPVLVRVMGQSDVTPDMGDRTNITSTQKLSPLEQAANDSRRFSVENLSFDEQGNPTAQSIGGFVSSMPVSERGDMLNPDGTPTRQAVDRLMSATFKQAYDSDELVQLHAQATDPDARSVLAAAADASGVMAALRGAGDFDVRGAVTDAVKMAVNASRQGLKLSDVLQNADFDMNPEAYPVATFLAKNIRSPKAMAEGLRRWGQLALQNARTAEENQYQGGLLGPAPTLSRQEIFARIGDAYNPTEQAVAARAQPQAPVAEQASIEAAQPAVQPAAMPVPGNFSGTPSASMGARTDASAGPGFGPRDLKSAIAQIRAQKQQAAQQQPTTPTQQGFTDGAQADQTQQGSAQPAQTQQADAPGAVARHPTWRKNAIQAGRVARELGLAPKGKSLPQIVAEVDAHDAAQNHDVAPATQAQAATENVANESAEDNYLEILFGASASEDTASNAPEQSKRAIDVAALVPALRQLAEKNRTEANDWAGRQYKSNKTQIDLRGDGPSRQDTMSVTAANESRRSRAVESLTAQAKAADSLANKIDGGFNLQSALDRISDVVDSDIRRDGGRPRIGTSRSDMMEGYISSNLLGDGNYAFGKGTVAREIRLAYEESSQANQAATPAQQAQEATENVADAQPAAPALTTYTPADIEAQQARQEQAAKTDATNKRAADSQAKADDDRKRIAAASVAAADSFELGQDPMDSLTGQQDVFADTPQGVVPAIYSAAADYILRGGAKSDERAALVDLETGKVLAQHSGEGENVDALPWNGKGAVGIMHNHPGGGTLSIPDVKTMFAHGYQQVAAVNEDGTGYFSAEAIGSFNQFKSTDAYDAVDDLFFEMPVSGFASNNQKKMAQAHFRLLALQSAGLIKYEVSGVDATHKDALAAFSTLVGGAAPSAVAKFNAAIKEANTPEAPKPANVQEGIAKIQAEKKAKAEQQETPEAQTHANPLPYVLAMNQQVPAQSPDKSPSKDVLRAAASIPTFQGGKTKMARAITEKVRRHWGSDAAKIDTIIDYFGGSGSWGAYMAGAAFPSVKRLVIHEFNPERLHKIRLFNERGDQIEQLLAVPDVKAYFDAVKSAIQKKRTFSGSAIANVVASSNERVALRKAAREAIGGEAFNGLLQAVEDQGTASFGLYGKGKSGADAVNDILRRVAANAGQAYAQMQTLRERGVAIEYVTGNSYEAAQTQGNNVLAMVDPPYYATKGYNGVSLVDMATYNETRKLLDRLQRAGNSVIYTDEAWWEKHDKKTGDTVVPPDVNQQIDGLDAFGQLSFIQGLMGDFFRMPIATRMEVVGFINGDRSEGNTRRGAHPDNRQTERGREAGDNARSMDSGAGQQAGGRVAPGNAGGTQGLFADADAGLKGGNPRSTATKPAQAQAPAKRKLPPKLAAKAAEVEAQRAAYFAPGNVVASYAGNDRVVAYTPADAQGNWSVTVQAVQKQGNDWVNAPGKKEHTHSTQPDARALKAGPVVVAKAQQRPATEAVIFDSALLRAKAAGVIGVRAGMSNEALAKKVKAHLAGERAARYIAAGKKSGLPQYQGVSEDDARVFAGLIDANPYALDSTGATWALGARGMGDMRQFVSGGLLENGDARYKHALTGVGKEIARRIASKPAGDASIEKMLTEIELASASSAAPPTQQQDTPKFSRAGVGTETERRGQDATTDTMALASAPDASQIARPLRTPVATIRTAITQAYGKLLGQLEAKGLVTLTQTQEQAIEAAAQARADKTGGDVAQINQSLMAAVKKSIRAWHGSPHRFDKFSTAEIGSGEGAQVYGWGLYFAGNREVAQHYREKLNDDPISKYTLEEYTIAGDRNWLVRDDNGITSTYLDDGELRSYVGSTIADDAISRSDNDESWEGEAEYDLAEPALGGALYAVDIAPDEDAFLLWDKPLSQQSDAARSVLDPLYSAAKHRSKKMLVEDPTGSQIYEMLTSQKGGDQQASEYLKSLGVPGIKYLDGSSRDAGEGSHNYVVFDDADVGIVDIKFSANGAIQGFFDPQTGQSFLVADNLTAQAAPGVLMHEVGIHMAADKTLTPLFNRAKMLLKAQKANPFMQRVQAKMDAAGETSAEEAAAYMVEAYENDRAKAPASVGKWLADMLATVKAWLHQKGIVGADSLTVADIAAVARANAKSLAQGQTGPLVAAKANQPATPVQQAQAATENVAKEQQPRPASSDAANFAAKPADRPGTAQDKAVMQAIADGKSARDVLRLIAEQSKDPFRRQVARLLLKSGITPALQFVHIGKSAKGDPIHGQYRGKTDTIAMAGTAERAAEHIFLHEAMHAATMRALAKPGIASLQLRKLFQHVQKQRGAGKFYGMTSVDEFVAEVFTNPDFQAALRKMTAPPGGTLKSAWDSFVRILRGILNLPNDSTNALSQALELGVAAMRDDMVLRKQGGKNAGRDANFGFDSLLNRNGPSPIDTSMGALTPEQEATYKKVAGVQKAPTLKERMDSMKANLGLRMKQALVDQFAPIRDVSQRAYMLARMSKAGDAVVEALLYYGKPFMNDGVMDVKIGDGGFANVLASLKGEHDRFFMWVAAQRAERIRDERAAADTAMAGLNAQMIALRRTMKTSTGKDYSDAATELRELESQHAKLDKTARELLFDENDIAAFKSLNTGKMGDGTVRLPVYAKALQNLNDYNEAALKTAMESGLIDKDTFELMKSQPYVPFYRLMENDGAAMGGAKLSAGLTNQKAWEKLKGSDRQLNADLLQNVMQNWSHLYAASARNRAAVSTMAAAYRMGVATRANAATKGAVKISRKGVAEYWTVEDPYLLEAISAINYQASPLMKPLAKAKSLLTFGVTINPTFKIRNLIRDSLSAISQSELGYNPLKNVKSGWKLTASDSQMYASMLASGGVIKFGSQENNDRLRAKVAKLGGVLLDQNGLQKFQGQLKDLYDVYAEFGDRTENVNRVALYDQLTKNGKSHAEASFMARDLMDFSMGGAHPLVRFLTQTVPFLNARLQGLYKLGRAANEDPRKFATMAMAVSVASVGLMALFGDDDDWKKREDWDRDAYWWFKVGGTAFRIPKPFELGAIGTIAERTFELGFDDEMTGKRFMQRMGHMVAQTFALDPIPQAFKPLLDVYANKDSFTKRAIESQADQRLRPQDRYNERTSEVAKLLGSLGLPEPSQLLKGDYAALSPKQVDHLIRGYFSWLGVTVATVSDFALRPMMDRGERPDMRLRDVFIAGNFVESLPTGSSRYVSQLYEQSRSVEQAFASYREAIKTGDMDGAAQIKEANIDKLRNRVAYANATKQLSEINAQAKRIEASTKLDGEAKRERLTELELRRGQVAERLRGKGAD